jgi:hypothetical protein
MPVDQLKPGGVPMSPFGIKAALMRTNGKPKLLRRIILAFRDKYANAAKELTMLIAERRNEDAERLAHSLKGLAATLEARDLAESASAIEYALRNGQTNGLGPRIDSMQEELIPAIAAANSLELIGTSTTSPTLHSYANTIL